MNHCLYPRTAGALAALLLVTTARAEPSFYTARVAPILDRHCVVCHGAEKQKAGLRVDSLALLMKGAESGPVVKAGDVPGSELLRRVKLPKDDEEVMPNDGKPLLTADEIKILELWVGAGAPAQEPVSAFPHAPVPKLRRMETVALTADWRPKAKQIAAIEQAAGVRLVPRSQLPTDGLILRTASAPARCNDVALEKLAPVVAFIVEAELARTNVSDAGLKVVGQMANLRHLDLTSTKVTSDGLAELSRLTKLEAINLTNTGVDERGVAALKPLPSLKQVWVFGTKFTEEQAAARPGSE